MVDAGSLTVTAFISPYKEDRDNVRAILEDDEFIEVIHNVALKNVRNVTLRDYIRKHVMEKYLNLQELAHLTKLQNIQKLF